MSSTPEFRSATRRAIQDRAEALADIARQLASEFLADPAKFDPEDLAAIGRSGLRQFLVHLGTEPDMLVLSSAPAIPPEPDAKPPAGWTRHPDVRWPPLPHAVCVGFASGLLAIGLCAAALSLS